MKVTATNECDFGRPKGEVRLATEDWYNNKTEKYLMFEFEDKKQIRSAYNVVYAISKRRGNMRIKRHMQGNKLILERL